MTRTVALCIEVRVNSGLFFAGFFIDIGSRCALYPEVYAVFGLDKGSVELGKGCVEGILNLIDLFDSHHVLHLALERGNRAGKFLLAAGLEVAEGILRVVGSVELSLCLFEEVEHNLRIGIVGEEFFVSSFERIDGFLRCGLVDEFVISRVKQFGQSCHDFFGHGRDERFLSIVRCFVQAYFGAVPPIVLAAGQVHRAATHHVKADVAVSLAEVEVGNGDVVGVSRCSVYHVVDVVGDGSLVDISPSFVVAGRCTVGGLHGIVVRSIYFYERRTVIGVNRVFVDTRCNLDLQVLHGFAEVGGEIVIGISRCGCLAICAPSRVEEVAVADVAVEEVLNWAFRRLCAVGPKLRNIGEQAVVAEVAVGRGIAFVGKALLVSGLHVGNEGSEIFVALELVDRAENGVNLFLRNVEEAPARVRALGVPHYECVVVAGAVQGGTFGRAVGRITDNGVFNQRGALDNEGILVLRINEVGFFGFFSGGNVRASFVNHAEVALRVEVLHIIAGSVFLGNEFPDVLSILCRRRFGHFPRLSVGPVRFHAVVVNGIRLGAHRTEVVPAFLNGHCACLGGSNGGFAACYGCFGLFLRQVVGVQECLCCCVGIHQFVVEFLADLSRFGTGIVKFAVAIREEFGKQC